MEDSFQIKLQKKKELINKERKKERRVNGAIDLKRNY